MSVTHKFSILLAAIVAGTALIQGVVLYKIASDGLIELERDRLAYRIQDAGDSFSAEVQAAMANVRALAETPPIQGIIDTTGHGGYFRQSTTADWQQRLAIIFTGFLKVNPSYSQLRYLGIADGGREIVRVERVGSEIKVRTGGELQSKENRDYFRATIGLPPDAVYISDINLNREFGAIVTPVEPTVRIAVPVFAKDGAAFGMVVLNIDFRSWSKVLTDAVVRTDRIYLTDQEGNFLLHPDPALAFGWEFGSQADLTQEVPSFAPLITEGSEMVEALSSDDVLFGYRLHFDPQDSDRFVVLAASSPREVLLASTYEMQRWSIAISFVMVVLALILAQRMARPFVQLMTAARRVVDAGDNEGGEGKRGAAADFELIADAFQAMEDTVQEREAELRETEATANAILESAANSIVTIDENGCIEMVNRAARTTFGYHQTALLGRHISTILAAADGWTRDAIPVGSQHGRDLRATCRDGTVVPTLVTVAKVNLERETLYTVAIMDLRELRKAEQAKNEFVSVVSHELRTPLTSIRGALGLLQGPLKGELTPRVTELTAIAHKNSERLINIINDILDIEKLESGKVQVHIEPLDADTALRQAVEANAPYGDRYGVVFELVSCPSDVSFLGDAGRFQQIMSNLLSNAAKFSGDANRVEIAGEVKNGFLHVTVRDFGQGISEEFQPQVFGKFVQDQAALERRHEGTGLGLAITRMLARAMGGDVRFETEPGKGTCFDVNLRLADPPLGAAADDDGGLRVLICEDDPDTRSTLSAWISSQGRYGVDAVASLQEARDAMSQRPYAAVLLDLVLPDGDGGDLIRDLHEHGDSATRIIVISIRTASAKEELQDVSLPVADWLTKPVSQQEVLASLDLALMPTTNALPRILHVEDDEDISRVLAGALEGEAQFVTSTTLARSRLLLAQQRFALVILDIDLPDGSGLDILKVIDDLAIRPEVMILSASEIDEDFGGPAVAKVVKSRLSEQALVELIRKHLPPPQTG